MKRVGVAALVAVVALTSAACSRSSSKEDTTANHPATVEKMLDFCARHHIAPVTELFPMSKINDGIARLRSGKARYRVVLQNDLN